MTFKERIQQFRDSIRVAKFVKELNDEGHFDMLNRAKYWVEHPQQAQSYADLECDWVLLPSSVIEDLPTIIHLLRTDPHQSYLEKGIEQVAHLGIVGRSVIQGAANLVEVAVSHPQEIELGVQLALENKEKIAKILENKPLMSMIKNKQIRDYWKAHPDAYRDFGAKNKCESVLVPKELKQQLYDFIDPMNVVARQKRREAKVKKQPVHAAYKQAFESLNKGLDALHKIRKSKTQEINQQIKSYEDQISGLMEVNKLRQAHQELDALYAQKITSRQVYSKLEPGLEKEKIDTSISEFKKALTQAALEGVEIAKIDLATYALGEDPYNIIAPFYTVDLSEQDKEKHREVLREISKNSSDLLCKQRAKVALSMDNIKMHREQYTLNAVADLRALARISRTAGDVATKLWANNFCNTILNDDQYRLYKKDMQNFLNQEKELAHQADALKIKLHEQMLLNQTTPISSFRAWVGRLISRFLALFSSSLPNEVYIEKEPQSEFGIKEMGEKEILTEDEKMEFELCSHEMLQEKCDVLWQEYTESKNAKDPNETFFLKKAKMADAIYVRRTSPKDVNSDREPDLAVLNIDALQAYLVAIQSQVKKVDQKMLDAKQALSEALAQGPIEQWKQQSLEWDLKWAQQKKAQEDSYAAFIAKILAKKIGSQIEAAHKILSNPQEALDQKAQARAALKGLQKDAEDALHVTHAFIALEREMIRAQEGENHPAALVEQLQSHVKADNLEQLEALQLNAFLVTQGSGKILDRMLRAGQEEEDFTDAVYAHPQKTPLEVLEVQLKFREENVDAAQKKVEQKKSVLDNLLNPEASIGGYLRSWLWKAPVASDHAIEQAQLELNAAMDNYSVCEEAYQNLLEIYEAREDNPDRPLARFDID